METTGNEPADTTAVPTLGERLQHERRRRFVGRADELATLSAALDPDPQAPHVFFVHGPGGVGKTALLGALTDAAAERQVPTLRVDLRAIEPSPPGVRAALGELPAGDRVLLVLDNFEAVAPLEDWVCDELLPGLPDRARVVIAGRSAPSPRWLADPGWRGLMRVVALRNLPADEAREFLEVEGVAPALHEPALAVSHGHPLALSLIIDLLVHGEGEDSPALELERSPDLVAALLERFLDAVPTARHREALHVCAHARVTTEDLLAEALGGDDTAELFAWLRGLSFIEQGPDGLFAHDLARDALDADLRWRDREAYARLHGRIRRHVVERIRTTGGREQQRASADLQYLHRGNRAIRPFYDWETLGKTYADRLGRDDREPVLAMVARHETPESVRIAKHWMERQPERFLVFRRGGEAEPIGFAAILALHEASEGDLEADPGTRALWNYAMTHGAPRPGEEVYATRFFMDRDAYQAPSPSFNLIAVTSVQHYVRHPRMAWDFIACWDDPDALEPMMSHIDYHRAPEADFELAGRRCGVFAHDWRRTPLDEWLDLMERRELAEEPAAGEPPPAPQELALAEDEFREAVRAALRDLARPAALAESPLARTRMVRERDPSSPPGEVLEALLREEIAALQQDPRAEKLHRALDRTYARPAPSQEAAAELLGLPLSTYRRHLARGIERVQDALWERELYGS